MKQLYRILLSLSFVLVIVMEVSAQRVSFVEPKEDSSITVSPERVKIIINSNSDKMVAKFTLSDEKWIRTTNEDGTYRYTIDYSFPEDYEDDFIRTTLTLTLPAGQQEMEKFILYKGKAYVGTFNENFTITVEKNETNNGVFPQAKSAQITFFSSMKRLNIECSGKACFIEGKAVPVENANMTASVSKEGEALNAYNIVFMLDEEKKTPTFVKRPTFKITVGNSPVVDVDFGEDLQSKSIHSYTVVSNVKVIEKELSFEESLAKAQASEKSFDFYAATKAYEDARSHRDCPADRKTELETHLGRVNSARRFLFYAEKFESQGAEVERKEGFTADSVFIYYRGAIRSYKKVLEYAPDATVYAQRADELDVKLKNHPMNNKETTVTVKYQEITGKHPNGGGIPIYASYTSGKPKTDSDDRPLGTTRGDGSFRLVFKDTPPPYLYFHGDKHSYAIDSTTTEINF
ncbi:hypothetical protein [Bacteroides congonensis]|uniref:hypothetical protein n=1 Tax=Bacteroides congonensis TaxID=1871006 RepID=UPI002FD8FE88